ncbi:hypothetical protein KBC04_01815 [Candidatus Babeliales bacterium]|nr:hypothetical protein [Candidatus Babeliales bacterium]MBP9843544.1 hypothetical protein [Candidatus Babeliales bacterium]
MKKITFLIALLQIYSASFCTQKPTQRPRDFYRMSTAPNDSFLSSRPCQPTKRQKDGICKAIHEKDIRSIIKFFTTDNIDINSRISYAHGTVLHELFARPENFDMSMLKTLLNFGVNPNIFDEHLGSPLTNALYSPTKNNLLALELLLEAGALVDLKSENGSSAWENRGPNKKTAELLQKYKEKPNSTLWGVNSTQGK